MRAMSCLAEDLCSLSALVVQAILNFVDIQNESGDQRQRWFYNHVISQ